MKKRIFLSLAITLFLICLLAVSISAVELIKSESDEFGEVNDIAGITTSVTDKTAKIVLKNSDNTYSTFYTYTIFPKLNWRNDMSGASFTALNEKLGTEYELSSVIRIEVLTDCEYHAFDSGIYANLKEIHFPKDSKVTQIRRYYSNVGVLEKINIPSSVTGLDQNAFRDCTGLKEVNFDANSSLTTITKEAFRGCSSLECIALPNTITTIGESAFYGCTLLKDVRFGENTDTIGKGAFSGIVGLTNVRWYVSEKFMSSFTGEIHYNYFGNSYTPTVATLYFTGTLEEANALKAKATHTDAYNGSGGMKNAILVEYDPTKSDEYYESDTNWTIVYNYNKCKAFYGGVHLDPTTQIDFAGEDYFTEYQSSTGCQRCNQTTVTKICDPLFTSKGYSKSGNNIVFVIKVNTDAVAEYNLKTGANVKYGIVVSPSFNGGDLITQEGKVQDNFVLNADFTGTNYSMLQIKITGILSDNYATELHCCAYIVDNAGVTYLYEKDKKAATGKYANLISYEKIA